MVLAKVVVCDKKSSKSPLLDEVCSLAVVVVVEGGG